MNTRFFHQCASQQRKKNRITELVKEDGSLESGEEELDHMERRFYMALYTSEGVQGVDEVMWAVLVRVDAAMNGMLDVPFDMEEVKDNAV
jgi:hypothetical protein